MNGVSEKDVSEISISIVLSMDNGKEQDGWAGRQPFFGRRRSRSFPLSNEGTMEKENFR